MAKSAVKKSAEETGPVDPFEELQADLESIQAEAKQTFSLRDKLKNAAVGNAERVPLFLDTKAVTARNYAQAKHDEAKQRLDFFEGAAEAVDARVLSESRKEVENLAAELKAANEKMLASALSVHLRAIPRIEIKIARREERKRIVGKKGGQITADRQEEFDDAVMRNVINRMLIEVRDAEGNVYDNDAAALQEDLPEGQWNKLVSTVNRMSFVDAAGNAATDDPGF